MSFYLEAAILKLTPKATSTRNSRIAKYSGTFSLCIHVPYIVFFLFLWILSLFWSLVLRIRSFLQEDYSASVYMASLTGRGHDVMISSYQEGAEDEASQEVGDFFFDFRGERRSKPGEFSRKRFMLTHVELPQTVFVQIHLMLLHFLLHRKNMATQIRTCFLLQ